jgi:predicted P-loop ATPase
MPTGSRGGGRIDFRRVADAALASLESLLLEWLPGGRRDGREFKALNPTRADSKVGSFSVNLNTGAWADFATGDNGGDAISLLAYLHGIAQLEAAKRLAEHLGVALDRPQREPSAAPTRPQRGEWDAVIPAPAHASALPKAHIKRGKPEAVWEYRTAAGELIGAVYRFRTSDGGKEVLPCSWAKYRESGKQEWRWLAFPEPRPLYGLDRLGADGVVLVVEGEKCADAARAVLPAETAVVTWPGGAKAVDKADWSALAGRKVIVWPDCDAQQGKDGQTLPEAEQPGMRAAERIAAILTGIGCMVRIIEIPAPGAKPAGWDVADAIAEGWSPDQVRAFVRDNLRRPACAEGTSTPDQAAPPDDWKRELVHGGNGALLSCVANAFLILTHRPEWRNVLAFDEFAQRPVKRMPPPFARGVAGDWEGMDDSFSSFWLATRAGLTKISSVQAAEAAEMAARAAPFDPVREYLEGLTWDRVPRLEQWLADFFGAPDTPYTRLVGRLWLVGLVKRAFEPGCKFDYMPILEGPQGKGKSTALEILAHPWFGNTDFVMGDKDSMAVMQGKWLYEIAELDSFNKADTTRVKSFVTRQFDEFRPAYGRRVLKIPRRVVLVGTTNQFEYFKDATGNRRFWPIKVLEQIELDGLRAMRDQLLAEAVEHYRAGERTFPTREEQEQYITPEQDAREIADAWEEGVHRYLEDPGIDGRPEQVSGYDVLTKGLKIDPGKITKEMSQRVGMVMRKLKWKKVERRLENPRFVYERPQKSAQDMAQAQQDQGVPF